MHRNIPNQLTVLRLVLAALFFIVLNTFRYPDHHSWALPTAIGIFIIASITDALDGYLARLWQAESTFGRIMDPFCDKVLILGAFIYLSGPRMVDPAAVKAGYFLNMASGVYPWMVALILARELLVTNIRGELEESGVRFPALYLGKLKMILQSVTVPIVLLIVHYQPGAYQHTTLNILRDTLVYTTVVVTVLSGVPYVTKAVRVVRGRA
jgi:CDP-diacylglycerol--glycerol-3-phosphate 3-phosphatidyltransferase